MTKKNTYSAPKPIRTVCLPCGRARDRKHKEVFGVWQDACDLCGAKDVPCASAGHDFGIFADEESKLRDLLDDLL